jgi:hypothetical protein
MHVVHATVGAVGFWRDIFLGGPAMSANAGLLSWYSPQDSIQSLFIADALPVVPDAITRDLALRIPAVKRAHDITCTVLADMRWVQHDGDVQLDPQPRWLVNSQIGVPPRDLRWSVVSDLFMSGWAAIGFKIAGGQPADAIHIPRALWSLEDDGRIMVKTTIPAEYRQRVIPIRLGYGSNGFLTDAIEDIRAAISIRDAYKARIENPIAQQVLSLVAERWDSWSKEEREEFRQLWIEGRSSKGGAVAMKPDWVTVETTGTLPTDLFESGRNGNRLDLANHAGLPASLLEATRQGGSGGGTEMRYTGVANGAQRSEVWDFGLSKYASAIAARLSLDDVCPPGQSIRVDTSQFLTSPNPPEQQTSED